MSFLLSYWAYIFSMYTTLKMAISSCSWNYLERNLNSRGETASEQNTTERRISADTQWKWKKPNISISTMIFWWYLFPGTATPPPSNYVNMILRSICVYLYFRQSENIFDYTKFLMMNALSWTQYLLKKESARKEFIYQLQTLKMN